MYLRKYVEKIASGKLVHILLLTSDNAFCFINLLCCVNNAYGTHVSKYVVLDSKLYLLEIPLC
jgi:hypothetical protein